MTRSRAEHLAWCKQRALEILDGGDQAGAVASLLSDLGKWHQPLYDPDLMRTLIRDVMTFRKTPAEVRNWVEGFA